MIVPTAFAARALLEASLAFNDESYLQIARSACDFILIDLNRTNDTKDEICWSYSPLDRTHVFNASLLAAETLASVSALTGEKPLCELAERGARYVVRRQRDDGSWAYGGENFQSWADNFHTAFILTSLSRIMSASGVAHAEFYEATKRGYEFWKKNFFLARWLAEILSLTGFIQRTLIRQAPPLSLYLRCERLMTMPKHLHDGSRFGRHSVYRIKVAFSIISFVVSTQRVRHTCAGRRRG